jgi:hypothetical protein
MVAQTASSFKLLYAAPFYGAVFISADGTLQFQIFMIGFVDDSAACSIQKRPFAACYTRRSVLELPPFVLRWRGRIPKMCLPTCPIKLCGVRSSSPHPTPTNTSTCSHPRLQQRKHPTDTFPIPPPIRRQEHPGVT